PHGDIFLIARRVENSGDLIAEDGIEQIIAGCDVLVRPHNGPAVLIRSMELDQEVLEENPYALAISHSGECVGNEVYFSADHGAIESTGSVFAFGGIVHFLGEEIHLKEDALIDVSHDLRGGTILVGGDYRGENPGIRNANKVV